MSAASTSSSAPSSASAAANTPTQVEVYHQLLKLKIKQCGHRNRLTDEEVETRERLFKLMYAERDTGVYFYSMDTAGYPEALISTTLNGETFWPSLVTKTFIEEDHWSQVPGPNKYYKKFYFGTWPITSAEDIVGNPEIKKQWPCAECRSTKSCNCSYESWPEFNRTAWIDWVSIHATGHADDDYGLVARQDIPAGEILGEYTGELVDSDKNVSDENSSYWSSIPMGPHPESKSSKSHGQVSCEIDCADKGSVWRFLNHSCASNAGLFVGRVGKDRRSKYVMTTKDIKKGEAVTIDYGWKWKQSDLCWCGKTAKRANAPPKRRRVDSASPEPASSQLTNANGDPIFVIDQILTRKMRKESGDRRAQLYYKVSWQGYDASWDSWVEEKIMREDVPDLVDAFDDRFDKSEPDDEDDEYGKRRPTKRRR